MTPVLLLGAAPSRPPPRACEERGGRGPFSVARLLAHLEGLDDVLDLDVVERPQADTALVALADLGDVVLEAAQRLDGEVVGDDHTVTHQPGLRVPVDGAAADDRPGDVADARHAEDLADLRRAERDLLVLRLEHALEGRLDLLDRLVDDRVVPDVDTLAVGQLGGLPLGPDVEAQDDDVVGQRQVDVALGDRPDPAVDDPQRDVVAHLDLHQGLLERLHGARVVPLDDQVELTALLEGRVEVLQADPLAHRRVLRVADAGLPAVGDLPGDAVLLDDEEGVTGTRHRGETHDLHGAGRQGLLQLVAVLVEQRPDAAVCVAGDQGVPDLQRAALHQHRGDRAATAVQLALDDHTLRVLRGVGPQVQRGVGGEQDRRQHVVDALTGGRGDVDEHRVAAVLLGHQPVLGELLADLGGVGPLLVDLVHPDPDRHLGGLGVVERLDRLRHDAVVGGHDQHHDVGDLGATGTHRGERLVTRGVDEGDRTLVALQLGDDLVGADVLGDATGLAGGDVGVPQRVQELGLPVVDVTHDGHDRRTDVPVALVALLVTEGEVEGLEELAVLVLGADDLDDPAALGTAQLQRLVVDRLRGGDHLAQVEQGGDQRGRLRTDALGQVGQRGTPWQPDGLPVATRQADAAHAGRRHGVELLAPLLLALAPADRTATTRTPEGTRGARTRATTTAATTAATAAGTEATGRSTAAATGTPGATATGTEATAAATAGTTRTATTAGSGAAGTTGTTGRPRRHHAGARTLRHHARVGTRPTRTRGGARPTRTGRGARATGTGSRTRATRAGTRPTGAGLAESAARTRTGGSRTRGAAEGVVARPRSRPGTRARARGGRAGSARGGTTLTGSAAGGTGGTRTRRSGARGR